MSEIKKLIEIALDEEGYLEKKSNKNLDSKTANAGSKNYTKYARDLDNIKDFYNGKKNGYAWCDVFVDWCFVQAFGVDRAKELLKQPNKSLGAGTKYSMNYYKKNKQFHTKPNVGDQIFFENIVGSIVHTGIVYKVDKKYVYTVEGNTSSASGVVTNGGCVRMKKYALSHKYIAGYGRPLYKEEVKPVESTKPTSNVKYVYNCDYLNVRKGPSTNKTAVNELIKGTKVTVHEEKNGWARIGDNQWVSNNYLTTKKPSKVYTTKVVNTSSLNVRTSNKYTGTSNIAKTKAPLPKGTLVSIILRSGSGTQIGEKRWVYTTHLK